METNKIETVPLILLCGGKSSRMGCLKGLIDIDGEPLLINHLKNFSSVGGKKVIIVLGYKSEEYLSSIPVIKNSLNLWSSIFEDNLDFKAIIKINDNFESGQFSSLVCGLEEVIKHNFNYTFISPVDIPPPTKSVWNSLLAKIKNDIKAVIPSYKGRGGHPVLLSLDFAKEIFNSPKDSNSRLDFMINTLPEKNIAISMVSDDRVLLNLNTKEDISKLKH